VSLLPEAGGGRAQLVDQVALRLGILRGLSRFLDSQLAADGSAICKRHRVEHTGKLVYGAVIDLTLWRFTREEDELQQAVSRVLRTVDMLGEDPESHVPVFLPGRVDPRNASTNAIDGGACADVLATMLEEVPDAFSDSDRERTTEALVTHVEGYLRHAARARPITAQRLWAATGVARAARLLGRDDWRADALAGCRLALEELSADGIAPYVPEHTDHCTHDGLADISGFYHSRTPGFVLYVYDILGEPLDDFTRERLTASLDALVAMRDGNGRKVMHNEAKAWYWESDYEVASHPFDVYALHTGARLLDRPDYTNEAGRAMEEWLAHLSVLNGAALSHNGGEVNFQCPVFWSGHGAWAARVITDVPLRAEVREPRDIDLPSSGLLHVERSRYTAVLRGARRRNSNLFGCDVGGGALQSLVVREDPRMPQGEEVVPMERFQVERSGSFLLRPVGSPGRLATFFALLKAQRSDLRFRLFVAKVEWDARRWLPALLYPFRHMLCRTWADARPLFAAHRDVATTHSYDGKTAVFEGGLADWDGRRAEGVTTRRRYDFEDQAVALSDTLIIEGARGDLHYVLPPGLGDVSVKAEGVEVARQGNVLRARLQGGSGRIDVHGRWSC
jgi:hypothetical protein